MLGDKVKKGVICDVLKRAGGGRQELECTHSCAGCDDDDFDDDDDDQE